MSADALVVLCTCSNQESADQIAQSLIKEKLAACVQVSGPVKSHYKWEGKLEADTEFQLWIKSPRSRYSQLEKRLVELHDYDLPEIIAFDVSTGLEGYLEWVNQECRPS